MKYNGDSELPQVTDEMLQEALGAVRPYTIVVLKAGPGYSMPGPDRDPAVDGTVWAHGKRNFALRLAARSRRRKLRSDRTPTRSHGAFIHGR